LVENEDDSDPLPSDGSGACPNAVERSPSGSAEEVNRELLSKWWMKLGSSLPQGNPSLANVYSRVEKRMYEKFPWMRLGGVRNYVLIR
jgi:hypothetical protein